MTPSPVSAPIESAALARSRLAQRLRRVLRGEVLFDAFSRGRYASDASPLHAEPLGVVVPADEADVQATVELAGEMRVPVLPRGAGTGRGGQAIGQALILDGSRALNRILAFDPSAGVIRVQPGLKLAALDDFLRPHGLCFPVELPGAGQATLGGVIATNACGLQAMSRGEAVHHLLGVDALLSDGTREFLGPFGARATRPMGSARTGALVSRLFEIAARERAEILRAWPRVARRIGGYNLDAFHPSGGRPLTDDGSVNLGHLLAGSQGRLAHLLGLHLRLVPRSAHRCLVTICCASRADALAAAVALRDVEAQALLLLDPGAVEQARRDPRLTRALTAPAVLLVEFTGDDPDAVRRGALRLSDALPAPATVTICDPAQAEAVRSLAAAGWRTGSTNEPMLGWIDECAVPVAQLAEFEAGLTPLLARYGVRADWSGQIALGAPRLRLIDLRGPSNARDREARLESLRHDVAILAARLRGGCLAGRTETAQRRALLALAFGDRLASTFDEVEALFDPEGLMAGGAARAAGPARPRPRGVAASVFTPMLDWRAPEASGIDALAHASGACDGDGDCRRLDTGWMCPSFRATRNERDSPRGRANTLRLAIAGELGADPWASPAMAETFANCLGCKACRSDCPSGVDVARMKIEVQHRQRPLRPGLADRVFADFPRYAPLLSRAGWLVALRDGVPGMRALTERWLGLARARSLPRLRSDTFLRGHHDPESGARDREVVLFADCFGNHQAPENLRAAARVLEAAGWAVHAARPDPTDPRPGRPLCCGRTYLACGDVEAARAEARRTARALAPHLDRGRDLVGLEPACLLTMRDEFLALGLGDVADRIARRAWLFEEFIARERAAGRFVLRPGPVRWRRALVQPHCHQRAFDAVEPMRDALGLVPGLEVEVLEAGCCGMGGDFGYRAEHHALSLRIGAQGPIPALAAAGADTVLVADGTGCRVQIGDAAGRDAMHLVRVLDAALGGPSPD